MPAEYEPTDAQRSLVEIAAAFGLTGAGFVQYFDSRLAYSRTPGPPAILYDELDASAIHQPAPDRSEMTGLLLGTERHCPAS